MRPAKPEVECDACKRRGECEMVVRGNTELWVCIDWRSCRAAQPKDLLTRPI